MANLPQNASENFDKEKIGKEGVEQNPVEKPEILDTLEKFGETSQGEKDAKDHQKIREQLESMDLEDNLKKTVAQSANDVKSLDDKKKLEYLLKITKDKGVIYAINVAKKMDDPYLLDTFHDALVKNGYYKDFLK